MKKKLLYFFSVSLGLLALSSNSFGQAATATWMLNADETATKTGDVIVASQTMSGLNLKGYNVIAASTPSTTGINDNVDVTAQRLNTSAADNSWGSAESAPVSGRYTEYQVSPIGGKDFRVQTVSIDFGDAGSTSTMRANIYYSLDDFATQVRLNPVLDPDDGIILPKYDAGTKWLRSSYTLAVVVPNSKSFKLRVYPWWPGGTSATKYLVQSNVNIAGVTGAPGTLPLNLLSFTAKPDAFGKTVALNWATTNEVNTKSFEIQRRTDDTDFVTINTLPSKNTAGIHNYSFTDNSATAGNSYYRIVQFDNDGASTISGIQSVTNKATAGLSIYPNPTTGTLNISHSAAGVGAVARVVNMDGKAVLQQALSLNATDTKIDVSQLTSGSYLLILDNRDQKSSLKFIKQ